MKKITITKKMIQKIIDEPKNAVGTIEEDIRLSLSENDDNFYESCGVGSRQSRYEKIFNIENELRKMGYRIHGDK